MSKISARNTCWILLCTLVVLRIILVARLGISDDEAYYWSWAQNLDLSYFEHPGLTAWLIWISEKILGHSAFAVRLPAIVMGLASLWILWLFAGEWKLQSFAPGALLIYLLTPLFGLGTLLMAPDSAMGLAWLGGLYGFWKIETGEKKYWYLAGLCVALGGLSKYTIVILPLSYLVFLMARKKLWAKVSQAEFWSFLLICAMGTLPTLIWNWQHHWASFLFHLHDRHAGQAPELLRLLQFLLIQVVLVTPVLFYFFGRQVVGLCSGRLGRTEQFILAMSLPIFLLFFIQSYFSEFKVHWAAPAFILPVFYFGLKLKNFSESRLQTILFLVFALPFSLLFYGECAYPISAWVSQAMGRSYDPKWSPMNDLFGWNEFAAHLRSLTKDEFLAGARYQIASPLEFAAQAEVWQVGKSRDQYAITQTPERKLALLHKNAIFIHDNRYKKNPSELGIFKNCTQLEIFPAYRAGYKVREFYIWRCEDLLDSGFGAHGF